MNNSTHMIKLSNGTEVTWEVFSRWNGSRRVRTPHNPIIQGYRGGGMQGTDVKKDGIEAGWTPPMPSFSALKKRRRLADA